MKRSLSQDSADSCPEAIIFASVSWQLSWGDPFPFNQLAAPKRLAVLRRLLSLSTRLLHFFI